MRRSRSSPLGRGFSVVATWVLALMIGLALAESLAGLALKTLHDKRPSFVLSYSDETLRRLYDTDQPGLYRQILTESWTRAETVYRPFIGFAMAPYRGRYLTISEAGVRSNGGAPPALDAPGPKVFVFGGSTTLGIGVGDDETIPAAIARRLAAAGRDDVLVYNLGVMSYYSTQERIALDRLLTAGIRPDFAVFIDGGSDFYYCALPDRSAWDAQLTLAGYGPTSPSVLAEVLRRSSLVQLGRHFGGDKTVLLGENGSFCADESEIAQVARRLDLNRRIIDATAQRLGFSALFVQQPVPTYNYDNRKRPVPVGEERLGYHMNTARGYPLMAEWRSRGQLWDHGLLWLVDLEPAEGNAYIDPVHYSPRFNQIIGERIAQAILAEGRLPPRAPIGPEPAGADPASVPCESIGCEANRGR